MPSFHLVDLTSQRAAVREHLGGKSPSEALAWLATKGRLDRLPVQPGFPDTYTFESAEGFRTAFFFKDGCLVIVGDHSIID